MKIKCERDMFRCRDCGRTTSYPPRTGDGRRCPFCDSRLFFYIGTYAREKIKTTYAPDRVNMAIRSGAGMPLVKG